jgi:hypothetical protein
MKQHAHSDYGTLGPLFEKNREAWARSRDPVTSHIAAESVRGDIATKLESDVLAAIKRHPHGLTNHELVTATGLTWNTCTPRIAPLVRKKLVVDSGERRKGPTNRACIVWKASTK